MPFVGSTGRRQAAVTAGQTRVVISTGAAMLFPAVRYLGLSHVSLVAQRTAGAAGQLDIQVQQGRADWRTVGSIVLDGTVQYLERRVTGRFVRVQFTGALGHTVDYTLSCSGV